MRLNGALAVLPAIALAQVVTITEYPNSCRATYTTAVTYTASSSGSRTSTVVQSTVTVAPTPFTDSSVNGGTPFAIEIQPAGYSKNKRQAQGSRTFLDVEGYLTSDASAAVQYVINNGEIRISGGQGQVTANETDLSVPFAASTTLKPIRTTFYSENLHLGWNNSAFDSGAAEFYQVQQANGTRIVVHLNGIHDASWIAVDFALRPTSDLEEPTTSTSVPGTLSIQPISSTSSSASATPSGNVDPTGACGVGTNNNTNCFGAPAGSCCSQFGFCGTGPEYCGTGCQAGFGTCDPVESSASPTSSWSQVSTTVAASSTSTPSLSTSSSASVQPPVIDSSSAVLPPTYESSTSVVPLPGWSSSTDLPSTYESSTSVSSLPEWSSTVALTIPPVVTSSDVGTPPSYTSSRAEVFPPSYTSASAEVSTSSYTFTSAAISPSSYTSASAEISPPPYPSPEVSSTASPSVSLSYSTSGSVTFTSTQETYSDPVSITIIPSEYPTIASEEPWYTETTSSPSFSYVGPSSSNPPIYSSLASSYASSTSSEASSWSSVISSQSSSLSSALSSASSGGGAAPSYEAPSSAPVSPPGPTATNTTGYATTTTTTTSSIASITSSATPPVGTGVGRCPDDNGILATDANGVQYVVGCSADFRGTDITSTRITAPYTSCYTICDGLANCGGYIWAGIDGSTNGVGTGYCYFKAFSGPGNFIPGSNTLVAVVRPTYVSGYTVPTNAPPPYTSDAQATPTPQSSAPVVPPSQAPSCAATAVPNPQFYASAPASRASSWLVLPSPTPCDFGGPQDWPLDDSYCNIDIPQGLEHYSSRFTTAFAGTNGVIAFNEGTSQYENQRLNTPTDWIPTYALAPFWDDQAMFGNETLRQGIYYQADATGVTIEFYLSRPYTARLVFHYTVSYSFANPGVWVISYFDVDSVNNDNGIFATVGMQGELGGVGRSFEYSFKTRSIYPGLVLTCDSNANICTSCTQQI